MLAIWLICSMALFELSICRGVRGTFGNCRHTVKFIPGGAYLKLKKVNTYPDHPTNMLRVTEAYRVDFDESILPEVSWKNDLEDNEYEVARIANVRSGLKPRFGRIRRQVMVYWKGYRDPDWVDEADLNCGALLDFDRSRAGRNGSK